MCGQCRSASRSMHYGFIVATLTWCGPKLTCMAEATEPSCAPRVGSTEQASSSLIRAASRVEGHQKCVDCHRAEYRHWLETYHATNAFDKLLTSETGRQFATKLKISPRDLATKSMCVNCHGMPQIDDHGRFRVIAGVSCEACHGPAGGDSGWLNAHASYGPPGTRRNQESEEHRQHRRSRCHQVGMKTSATPFELARSCHQCHIVGHEQLVNFTGHPSSSENFEFVKWTTGEVRHNYHLDQSKNALTSTLRTGSNSRQLRLMFVAGQLAKLNVSLHHRAASRDAENMTFSTAMETRIEEALDELNVIAEGLPQATNQRAEGEAPPRTLHGLLAYLEVALGAMDETIGDIEFQLMEIKDGVSEYPEAVPQQNPDLRDQLHSLNELMLTSSQTVGDLLRAAVGGGDVASSTGQEVPTLMELTAPLAEANQGVDVPGILAGCERLSTVLEKARTYVYKSAAREVELTAKQFVRDFDGSELEFLETERILPSVSVVVDDPENEAIFTREFKERVKSR